MLHKWKLIDSKFVLDEKWYRVRRDTVEISPGRVIDDYFLSVFNDIALVLAVTSNGDVPLVRQYKHGVREIITELPAGYINDEEEPLEAAKRELKEETGYVSSNWQSLGYFYKNSTKSEGNNVHIYLAHDAQCTDAQSLDENEDIEVHVHPFHKVLDMAESGELQGADSALAVLLAKKYVV